MNTVKKLNVTTLVLMGALLAGTAGATSWNNDGGTYTVDTPSSTQSDVLLSPDPLQPTTVQLIEGGSLGQLDVVRGGRLDMFGGSVRRLDIHGTGEANMYGGSIGREIVLGDSGTLTIYGSDFALDGAALPAGTYRSTDFLPEGFEPNENAIYDYVGGQLTGTLARGVPLDTPFYFFFSTWRPTDSTLVLVPEPSTALMIAAALAGVGWARRRSTRR